MWREIKGIQGFIRGIRVRGLNLKDRRIIMAARPRRCDETLEEYHNNLRKEEEAHQKKMAPVMFWPSSKKGTYYRK